MSTENLTNIVIARRERRITIELQNLESNEIKPVASVLAKRSLPVFEAGDQICGRVQLEIKGGRPVEKIQLALVCLTQMHWSQNKRRSIINSVFYGSENLPKESRIFFDRKKYMQIDLGKNSESKWTEGKHEIPFQLTLPSDGLPSSMSSCHGFIKHTIEVFAIDEDNHESRGEKEIIFLVPIQEKLDLHGRSLEKSVHILDAGKISLTCSLERKEYVSGETIPVQVSTVNDSNISVQPRVSIYQTQVFACEEMQRTMETCLNTEPFTTQVVEPFTSFSQIVQMPLSPNLVISLRSPFIAIKYFVYVTVDIPQSLDLSINLPFLVTTKRAHYRNIAARKQHMAFSQRQLETCAGVHCPSVVTGHHHQQQHPMVNKGKIELSI